MMQSLGEGLSAGRVENEDLCASLCFKPRRQPAQDSTEATNKWASMEDDQVAGALGSGVVDAFMVEGTMAKEGAHDGTSSDLHDSGHQALTRSSEKRSTSRHPPG